MTTPALANLLAGLLHQEGAQGQQELAASLTAGLLAPAANMDLLASLAALNAEALGAFASPLPIQPAAGNGKSPQGGGRGGGGRTRSGDSRSSSAYASRHQVSAPPCRSACMPQRG